MAVRQYIGARYIPIFADPIQWDNTSSYEPLTVVTNLGTSYVSKQSVPAGVAITNGDYWIAWADYNAQIEAYRAEVAQYNGRIEALEDGVPISDFSSNSTVKDAIDAIDDKIGGSYTSESTVTDAIGAIDDKIGGSYTSESTVTDAIGAIDDKIGGSYTSESTVTDAIGAIDDKIGGSYTSESTVDDAIDAVNDKLTNYIASKDFVSISGSGTDVSNIYIDANNGDDDNNGFWGHPVKTIARAFEIVNSNNSSDIYFHFISSGSFTIQNAIINTGQFHFMVSSLNSGSVTLNFDTLRAYNSYLHFSAEVSGQLSVTFTNENHFDACSVWCGNVSFTFNTAPNHNYCDFCFQNCTISTKIQIQLLQSRVKFTGTNTITQLADFNSPIMFFRFCNVLYEGTLNLNFIGTTTHAMLRFDESTVIFAPSALTISKPSALKYGLTFLRSFGIVPSTVSSIIASHISDSIFEGSNSIVQNKATSTIYS